MGWDKRHSGLRRPPAASGDGVWRPRRTGDDLDKVFGGAGSGEGSLDDAAVVGRGPGGVLCGRRDRGGSEGSFGLMPGYLKTAPRRLPKHGSARPTTHCQRSALRSALRCAASLRPPIPAHRSS